MTFLKEDTSFRQIKWLVEERFRVALCFHPDKASDEDLTKLIQDASKLLGQPFGHEYAVLAINAIIEVFNIRCLDRRHKRMSL